MKKIKSGKLKGKIVFVGRNGKPLYEAARILTQKYELGENSIAYLDLPSTIPKREDPEKIFKYILSTTGKTDHITFIDDGGFGRFMHNIRKIFKEKSKGHIGISSFHLANLTDGKSWILEKPHKAAQIIKALVFLVAQAHSIKRPEKIVETHEKIDLQRTPSSPMEQAVEKEVLKIMRTEAKARLRN
ncbi:MAG: hypothetical protein ABID38_02880 [Candidatus Diapherotrites archaeon]